MFGSMTPQLHTVNFYSSSSSAKHLQLAKILLMDQGRKKWKKMQDNLKEARHKQVATVMY